MRELSLDNCRLDKRYDVERQLGRGSYAEIFVARDTLASPHSPHHQVVIKALNVFLQDDLDPELERTLVENFQNEATALDRVRHPNIISRLGHGTARDLEGMMFHYLVLEFLEGGDLHKAWRERTITPKTAIGYIEQVCAGLRHAHRHDIIHRDIKPQNLLLNEDRNVVKIADFGVARVHQTDAPITRVGTNIYAPPEHSPLFAGAAHENGGRLTFAADIYSLAKTAYTLMTSEAPRFFANNSITELPISVRNEEWADELKRVLNKATLSEPAERHQTIDEFWTDLEEVRRMVAESETTTHVRRRLDELPQPSVSKGYTPLAPQQPRFNTSRELKMPARASGAVTAPLRAHALPRRDPATPVYRPMPRVEDHWPTPQPSPIEHSPPQPAFIEPEQKPPARKKRRVLRSFVTFALLLVLFAGVLYGTSVYLRGIGILPQVTNPFASARYGRANTDVNLRPGPSANNEPIGVVTRNSRVRVVRTENNWYEVDVMEQGRERNPPLPTKRGWLSGRYIDMEGN
ncbi:MAG: protein kinase [Blastocatellia bacterium]|nr:protein kinase [Blastocatellia bacterium]